MRSKRIRTGERAVEILKRTFDHWMDIARALEAGRQACLRAANVLDDVTRGEEGGGFSKVYSDWLKQHPKLKLSDSPASDKVVRSYLFKCLEHEEPIRVWRSRKSLVEQSRFSYPETVFKHWAKDADFIDPDAKPKRRGKKKDQKQKQDENSLDWARQRIKNLVDESGDWDNETPVQIAEKLESSHPKKAAEVAAAILGDHTVQSGLDWSAPEKDLIETLLGMIPHNEKSARVLRAVLKRITAAAKTAELIPA
jgi:hypothetical protein